MVSSRPGSSAFWSKPYLTFYIVIASLVICGCTAAADNRMPSPAPGSLSPETQTASITPAVNHLMATSSSLPGLPNVPATATVKNLPASTPSETKPAPTLAAQATGRPSAVPPEAIPAEFDPIQIRSPIQGAEVASPIPFVLDLRLEDSCQLIRVDLLDDSGALLFRQVVARRQLGEQAARLVREIEFEIRREPQKAYLIVRMESQPGVPLAVNTTNLLLQTTALPDLQFSPLQKQYIDIKQPAVGAEVFPGEVVVRGLTRAEAGRALRVQLVRDDGTVIAQRLSKVEDQAATEMNSFETTLKFFTSKRTTGRLVVFQNDGPNSEITHLASISIILAP